MAKFTTKPPQPTGIITGLDYIDSVLPLSKAHIDELVKAVRSNSNAAMLIADKYLAKASKMIVDAAEGTTLLHEVVKNKEAAAYLYENQFNLLQNTKDKDGWTALHQAVESHKSIAERILMGPSSFLSLSYKFEGDTETILKDIERCWPDLLTPKIVREIRGAIRPD